MRPSVKRRVEPQGVAAKTSIVFTRWWRRSERGDAAKRSPDCWPISTHLPIERGEGDYGERHGRLVSLALDSPGLQELFANAMPLPEHYGVGLDERVVEFPGCSRSAQSDECSTPGQR